MQYNYALEYATLKLKENQMGLKLNGTHWLMISFAEQNHNTEIPMLKQRNKSKLHSLRN